MSWEFPNRPDFTDFWCSGPVYEPGELWFQVGAQAGHQQQWMLTG